jgi:hypothetical protein
MRICLTITLLTLVMGVATLGLAQQPLPSSDSAHDFRLTLPPGRVFVINFVVNTGARVEARFNRAADVEAMGFSHPNSDLTEKHGQLTVECPGIDQHPIKKLVEPSGDNMGIRASQRGHFGMLWRNHSTDPKHLDIQLTFSPGTQVVITGHNAGEYRRQP